MSLDAAEVKKAYAEALQLHRGPVLRALADAPCALSTFDKAILDKDSAGVCTTSKFILQSLFV